MISIFSSHLPFLFSCLFFPFEIFQRFRVDAISVVLSQHIAVFEKDIAIAGNVTGADGRWDSHHWGFLKRDADL